MVIAEVREEIDKIGFDLDLLGVCCVSLVSECRTEVCVELVGGSPPAISGTSKGKPKSWLLNYTTLSFLMNGQLYAEYHRISNMLGLPHCSEKHWSDIIGWLGEHITKIAKWSCLQVLASVETRGDKEAWVTSYDGYYLTRGHYSNNSSATLLLLCMTTLQDKLPISNIALSEACVS